MNRLLKILGGVFVVFVLLVVALELSMDSIVLKGFHAAAPSALGVSATLEDAQVSLVRGKASLRGLHVGNPSGFKTSSLLDLGSIAVRIDTSSLLTDTIVIQSIVVDGLVVTYEKGLFNSNLGTLLESLSSGEDKPAGETPEGGKPSRKVVIEKLVITGGRMNFSVTGALGAALPIPLPPITLTDLGKEKEGVTVAEAIRRILTAIAGATGTALAGSAHLIGQGLGAVGEGAVAAVGGATEAGKAVVGGTVDAGKAVVGGAVDAGKAIGGGAVDAGKAIVGGVGEALNAVNPFKK